jgi:hypothetical protein
MKLQGFTGGFAGPFFAARCLATTGPRSAAIG